MPSDVQDALVTILSEKTLPVPELDTEVPAVQGFNLIATANDRDRGINELSSALRRRFNTVVLPLPATAEEEVAIVARRVGELGAALALPDGAGRRRRDPPRRHGLPRAARGRHRRRPHQPEGAERHAVDGRGDLGGHQRPALAAHFGDGTLRADRRRRPASSARSCAIRCTTTSPGASTSRRWSATATAGATSTTPAASWAERGAHVGGAPARHPPPRARFGAVGACGRSTRCSPTSCSSRRRPTPTTRCAGSATTELVPPVALLGYVVDRPAAGGVRAARRVQPGVAGRALGQRSTACRCEAIDLPLANTLAAGDDGVDGDAPTAAAPPVDPLGALAAAAGEPDAERWWEDVVEHRGDGAPAFDAVGEAMAAVRAGTRAVAGEARREAHMRQRDPGRAARRPRHGRGRVRGVARAGARPGADHRRRPTPRRCAACPKVKVGGQPGCRGRTAGSAAATGYGAGVRQPRLVRPRVPPPRPRRASPGSSSTPPTPCAGAGMPASPDHLIAASRLADALAALRGRPRAGLAEVLDAADVGASAALPLVHRRAGGRRRDRRGAPGRAAGAAGPRPARRPSAAARLKPEAAARTVELDLRTPNGLRRSHLLHRLRRARRRRGARSRRAAARAGRSARRGGWRGSPSCRCASSSSPATAPRVEAAATVRLVERADAGRPARRRWRPPSSSRCSPTCPTPSQPVVARRSARWPPTIPTSAS